MLAPALRPAHARAVQLALLRAPARAGPAHRVLTVCLQSVHNPMADSGLLHQLFNKLFWNIDYHRQFPITPCPSKAHCVF